MNIANLIKLISAPNVYYKFTGENLIAYEVANFLRQKTLEGKLDCIWFHVPNEGKRTGLGGGIMKALGLIPGVSDLVFMSGNKSAAIELKQPKAKQNENQTLFQEWCESHRVPYTVCHSVEEVEQTLVQWGFLHD